MKNIISYLKVLPLAFLTFLVSCKDDEDVEIVEVVDTLPMTGVEDGYSYVDLGLPSGKKWATCNVGAYKIVRNSRNVVDYDTIIVDGKETYKYKTIHRADYHGKYFAWGEITGGKCITESDYDASVEVGDLNYFSAYDPSWTGKKNALYVDMYNSKGIKTEYLWSYYKWGGASNSVVKYNFREECGPSDEKSELDICDDAVVQNWGGKWHMPNKADLYELKNNCYWVYYFNYNGTKRIGYVCFKAKSEADKGVVVSKGQAKNPEYTLNDPHIFFRMSGFKREKKDFNLGVEGTIWSSSLNPAISTAAHCLMMTDSSVIVTNCDRFTGRPVRAVLD